MTETEAPYNVSRQPPATWHCQQCIESRQALAEEVLHCLMTIWGGDNESDYNEVADRLDGIDEIVAARLSKIFKEAATISRRRL